MAAGALNGPRSCRRRIGRFHDFARFPDGHGSEFHDRMYRYNIMV